MKRITWRIVTIALLLASAFTMSAQDWDHDDWNLPKHKYYVGLNATLIPSLEFGVATRDNTSLHIKGGYLPNLSTNAKYNTEMMLAEVSLKFWLDEQRFEGFYCEAGVVGGFSNANVRELGIVQGAKSAIHFGLEGGAGYIWRFGNLGLGLHMNLAMLGYMRAPNEDKYVFRVHAPILSNTGINISYSF